MLDLDGVWRVYRLDANEVVALEDVSLRIDEGDFVSVVGPSGSGKSTLLQILGILDRPSRGSIRLEGRELGTLTDEERAAVRLREIGFVFQRFHLLAGLPAIENVALPLEAAGVSVSDRYERAAALLRLVGLGERLGFPPSRLSGGQRQRVAIARAIANEPRLILADEPTGELHTEDKRVVMDMFRQLHDEGHTIVVVTHDPEVARAAERHVEIRDGRVKEVAA